jgi:hypothetical protein
MFAPGGILVVKPSLANVTRQDPLIHVRVKFTSGRLVHTDKGVFHYLELEVMKKPPTFVPRLPYRPGQIPKRLAQTLAARGAP